ncbi:MAG: ATP-binding protein [Opitutus sp.]|nr:ATP-binding protein [Opitutus sp.]MCS6247735.1 ATP-binding protein [Opitutus sp.]MCS6275419.1 ATP-binding protein [Opitutus sp.]MCS6277765.1 ATP-binding protein [Opitutus sp.]MCS6299129.1 ATP-binding protein [Opitutus sp.]
MIDRPSYHHAVERALARSPIVALLGPRQCGKTSLARRFLPVEHPQYFDLEDPVVASLMENPLTALRHLKGLVVIDEAQRQPGLFPVLRVLADRSEQPATFLILGSASPELARQSSESLAGRVEIIEMRGFDLSEVGPTAQENLWLRGGFPRSFLAATDEDSTVWRKQFIGTFLERDLAALGFGLSPALMRRFWLMLAHYHGQIWNGTEIAASLGVAPNTARAYLDALEQTFMVRRLLPWHNNLGKRLVKTPKLYFRDTGLLHTLLGVGTGMELLTHPKSGASWEGFALEELIRAEAPDEVYFYAVHSGSELDLLMIKKGRRIGVEFKRADAPKLTRSMEISLTDLVLDELWVIYPGTRSYGLADKVTARPLIIKGES